MLTLELVIVLLLVILVVAILASSIKVVPEYQRLVVFRLGRAIGIRGPGLVFLVPIIDRGVVVDLRESYIEVTRQTCITRDNAPVDIDLLIYFRVVDPARSVLEVRDFRGAAIGIATTTLRAVVGDIELDEVLATVALMPNAVARAAEAGRIAARLGLGVLALVLEVLGAGEEACGAGVVAKRPNHVRKRMRAPSADEAVGVV